MANYDPQQHLAQRDPYLAGALAAGGWQIWMDETADSEVDAAELTGEAREKFLAGWNNESEEAKRKAREAIERELDDLQRRAAKGDPAR